MTLYILNRIHERHCETYKMKYRNVVHRLKIMNGEKCFIFRKITFLCMEVYEFKNKIQNYHRVNMKIYRS